MNNDIIIFNDDWNMFILHIFEKVSKLSMYLLAVAGRSSNHA